MEPIDLIFIDADHAYEWVMHDFQKAEPYAKYLLFHDIVDDNQTGVKDVWNEIRTMFPGKTHEFVDQYDTVKGSHMGLGLLDLASNCG